MMTIDFRKDGYRVALLAVLLVTAFFLPAWMRYQLQVSLAGGLVALGVMIQMRAGLVSFGQGLFYCLGAYAVGLLAVRYGITDIAFLLPAAAIISLIIGVVLGILLSRYREIFFAMLSMALSMILYGVLVKTAALGSTDGFNIPAVSYFGYTPAPEFRDAYVYGLSVIVVLVLALISARYLASNAGAMLDALAENEVRLNYLGASPRVVAFCCYVTAAVLSGIGGCLIAVSTGHIDPELTNWTTSGSFVFVALLAGRGSVIAPIIGFFLLEIVRTYALGYVPNAWQLILGIVMLAIILLLPNGLWSLISGRRR
ncbi:branched-chain amino acid ABC transporter permease [Bartonella apihabitans]|uniref:branched-chain amino acid ABC transporter permease n=1 Tax=Bartonella apihabitans TaxID=2750929 RepID=UPI0039982AF1